MHPQKHFLLAHLMKDFCQKHTVSLETLCTRLLFIYFYYIPLLLAKYTAVTSWILPQYIHMQSSTEVLERQGQLFSFSKKLILSSSEFLAF